MKTTITLRHNTARPCRSMICEAFFVWVDGNVDGFAGPQPEIFYNRDDVVVRKAI
jgi:hypothetical protein